MTLKTEAEKISYALGLSVGGSLKQSGVEALDLSLFAEAVNTSLLGSEAKIAPQEANQLLQAYFSAIQAKASEKLNAVEKEFFAKNKLQEGVVTLPSGLQYKVLKPGAGKKPTIDKQVKCHYHGTRLDGKIFDSSIQRGKAATFPVSGVIQGWVEALQLMELGAKWQLFIPSALAYGAQGTGNTIGPHETLIFEIELLEII